MNLSLDFTLEEMVASQTASRLGLDNTPNDDVIDNLTLLCSNLLQPLRDKLGQPIHISSGYRSLAVNTAVGGAKSSQHMLGQAADTNVWTFTTIEWAQYVINSGILFDQLILEFYDPLNPRSGWVHVSWAASLRNQVWTAKKVDGETKYLSGIIST
jgi:zinc D-Ala-D-Ala carboxypeptidase